MSRLYDAVAAFTEARQALANAQAKQDPQAVVASFRRHRECSTEFSRGLSGMVSAIAWEHFPSLRDSSDEVSQELMARYLGPSGPDDPRPEAQVVWLRTVATNTFRALASRADIEGPTSGPGGQDPKPPPEPPVLPAFAAEELDAALGTAVAQTLAAFPVINTGEWFIFLRSIVTAIDAPAPPGDRWRAAAAERQVRIQLAGVLLDSDGLHGIVANAGRGVAEAVQAEASRRIARQGLGAGSDVLAPPRAAIEGKALADVARQFALHEVDGHPTYEVLALEAPDGELGREWGRASSDEERERLRERLDQRFTRYRRKLLGVVDKVDQSLRPVLARLLLEEGSEEGS